MWLRPALHAVLFAGLARVGLAYSGGPPLDHAGVPWPLEAPRNCTGCHSGRVNQFRGSVALEGLPTGYEPGTRYALIVDLVDADPARVVWGFQAAAVACDFGPAGSIAVSATGTEIGRDTGRGIDFVRQNGLGKLQTRWGFDWVAPPAGSGIVSFHLCATAGDGSGTVFGDHVFCAAAAVDESKPPPVLTAVAGLRAARVGADLVWQWTQDPLALRGYRLYAVGEARSIASANATLPGAWRPLCVAADPGSGWCLEAGAAAVPGPLFFQVLARTPCVEGPH